MKLSGAELDEALQLLSERAGKGGRAAPHESYAARRRRVSALREAVSEHRYHVPVDEVAGRLLAHCLAMPLLF